MPPELEARIYRALCRVDNWKRERDPSLQFATRHKTQLGIWALMPRSA